MTDEQILGESQTNEGYQALLLLSGGKDSAYCLYRLLEEYPDAKILCVLVNNGFMSPRAIENATHITSKLAVDLLTISSRTEEFAAVIREAFLNLRGRGCYDVVDFADGKLIFEIGQRVAVRMGIPLVIGGLSWAQTKKIFGKNVFGVSDESVSMLFPLAVWQTDERVIRATIQREGLLPEGGDSPVLSNSSLIIAMAAIDILNLGYCSLEPEIAQLIREGKADRSTWRNRFELIEFATQKGLLDTHIRNALRGIGLATQDVVRGAA